MVTPGPAWIGTRHPRAWQSWAFAADPIIILVSRGHGCVVLSLSLLTLGMPAWFSV